MHCNKNKVETQQADVPLVFHSFRASMLRIYNIIETYKINFLAVEMAKLVFRSLALWSLVLCSSGPPCIGLWSACRKLVPS